MIGRIFLPFVFAAAACVSAFADDPPNFFVAPISTELQWATVSTTAQVYAIVNCNSLIVDGSVNLAALDHDAFFAALKNASQAPERVLLVCRYHLPADIGADLRGELKSQLLAVCEGAGYRKVSFSEVSTSQAWLEVYRPAASFAEPPEAREPLFEDELVRGFPVRTRLSKFVQGDVDCIVEVIRPIDGRTAELSAQLKSSIRQAVQAAQPIEKETLRFQLSSTAAGSDMVEALFSSRSAPETPPTTDPALLKFLQARAAEYKPSPALELARTLGFEKITYSHSADGGAPEKLVGKRAPNFRLARLDGGQLDLHEFIQGKPALITFWGLACGPCRREAPYLTKLDNKYSPAFSIIAVNAYNDERQAVAEYASSDKLTHPIVLQGQAVAVDSYLVGAYPTSFWVDASGNVIQYDVGFTSAEALERRIKKMVNHAQTE